jgi:hypothetical protein
MRNLDRRLSHVQCYRWTLDSMDGNTTWPDAITIMMVTFPVFGEPTNR